MTENTPLLFTPRSLRGLTLRNRIVLSPMLTYAARHGFASDWHFTHLAKYAVGGVGLVFVESTKVDPAGCSTPNDLGLWKDDFIAPLRRIVAFGHAHGAAMGIQLAHSGRKARMSVPWEGRAPLQNAPGVDHGEPWSLVGPSAIPHGPGHDTPRPLSVAEIADQVAAWGAAARRADAAGFDALEIHGAHGYLIHQFLSPTANRRGDAYGGSLAGRMRFALEVAECVRAAWPADKPLFFRVSAVDEDGWTLDDTVVLARALGRVGVDVVDCSSGGMTSVGGGLGGTIAPAPGYQVPYAQRVRTEAGVASMAVGLIEHAQQAEQILTEGRADLIAIGRALLHHPHWVLDAARTLALPNPFDVVPDAYGYWLAKLAASRGDA